MKKIFAVGLYMILSMTASLSAHCQMPCGIYHDNMVYDQVDQFVETMYKGVTILTDDKTNNAKEKNEFVRWVINKEKSCNDTSKLLTTYFLQQKIKPDEDDTVKRLVSAHKLLFLLVQIKQNADRKFVDDFADEWEKFKLLFHVEGYECQVEMMKKRKREEKLKAEAAHQHDHDNNVPHTHDHEHEHPDHKHEHEHSH